MAEEARMDSKRVETRFPAKRLLSFSRGRALRFGTSALATHSPSSKTSPSTRALKEAADTCKRRISPAEITVTFSALTTPCIGCKPDGARPHGTVQDFCG